MSPLFTQPPAPFLLERKLGGGYRIVLFPETVHAVYMHLTEEQYKELQAQMIKNGPEPFVFDERSKLTPEEYERLKEHILGSGIGLVQPFVTQVQQPQPTGNGRIVLIDAFPRLIDVCDKSSWEFICEHLLHRMSKGYKEYGTLLRSHNGRNALQDALDEALDGFMYATQVNIETPSYDAEELQRCFLEAAQLCKEMMEKQAEN